MAPPLLVLLLICLSHQMSFVALGSKMPIIAPKTHQLYFANCYNHPLPFAANYNLPFCCNHLTFPIQLIAILLQSYLSTSCDQLLLTMNMSNSKSLFSKQCVTNLSTFYLFTICCDQPCTLYCVPHYCNHH